MDRDGDWLVYRENMKAINKRLVDMLNLGLMLELLGSPEHMIGTISTDDHLDKKYLIGTFKVI